jgi:hypothetical protein
MIWCDRISMFVCANTSHTQGNLTWILARLSTAHSVEPVFYYIIKYLNFLSKTFWNKQNHQALLCGDDHYLKINDEYGFSLGPTHQQQHKNMTPPPLIVYTWSINQSINQSGPITWSAPRATLMAIISLKSLIVNKGWIGLFANKWKLTREIIFIYIHIYIFILKNTIWKHQNTDRER